MYSNPGATPGWNPNAASQPSAQSNAPPPAQPPQQQSTPQQQPQPPQMTNGQPSQHQQSPSQQWSPAPPNGPYVAPRPNQQQQQQQQPPISSAPPHQQAPVMQAHPDYRNLPPPQTMYPQQQYPGPPPMGYAQTPQPAPRQRTAIACRYCRRRKIRCTGFDQSEDGRCTNCQRFSQECIFTPVSAQAQAFVPAHTVWRGQPPPANAQLYGAFGQPLPQNGNREGYAPAPQQPGQYPPPPQGYQQQPPYSHSPQPGERRPNDEPHTPTLAPPNPAISSQLANRDGNHYAADPALVGSDHMNGARDLRPEMKDAGVQTDPIALPDPTPIKEPAS
ncbi:Hypothetical protein R9X50_00050200 [Acrodontium crateriforme]|uniref:Zn(2)-C6 fungal-type domain-containing protein n=1 Tax=Acrodontium crateriforme TaxID=150365 RepID=A0AAQ3M3B7_9PEZI|nr:Hypothetical protein R9X50_00050200 [Acrodontium crateriforme]